MGEIRAIGRRGRDEIVSAGVALGAEVSAEWECACMSRREALSLGRAACV
jgi:hypothetical protein